MDTDNQISIIDSFGYGFKGLKVIGQSLKVVGQGLKAFGEAIKDIDWEYSIDCVFSEQKKIMIEKILEYNWYLPRALNTGEYFELNRILADEVRKEDLDKLLIGVINRDKKNIELKVLEYFNSRKSIAEEAFKSSEMEMYYASVATLLTLIDGISNDLLKVDFFSKNRSGEPLTKTKANEIKDSDSLSLWEVATIYPLELVTNLTVRAEKRIEKGCKDKFNRHAVMHGIDNDYGTYINVCKCYAILSFLVNIYEIVNKVEELK